MCHQPQMSVIYEGDIVSVVSQECSSVCLQPSASDVPSARETGCSQQIYPMTGPDSHWMPLVHKYLHDFQQEKQDGVAFQDYQVGGKEVMPYC